MTACNTLASTKLGFGLVLGSALLALAACGSDETTPSTPAPTAGTTALAGTGASGVGAAGTLAPTAGTLAEPTAGTLAAGSGGVSAGTDGLAGTQAAGAGGVSAGAGGSATAGVGGSGGPGCLKGSGDYLAKGPYTVAKMDVSIGSSGMYTLFYPQPFDDSCKHPIVAWGNGTSVTGSGTYAFYNEHAASWGIVVAASHNPSVGSGSFHKAGLDYLLAQNDDSGSMFYQKLSPRAGTTGHSQGGIGANAGSSHANVEAIVNVQGAFGGAAPAGKAFLCLTGTADLSPEGCKTAVDGASGPALHANWQGGDHTGTATAAGYFNGDPGTKQYMRFFAAWFRCFLADDSGACSLFMGGDSCPVCGDTGWAEIYARNY
jgi:hypothetical protein